MRSLKQYIAEQQNMPEYDTLEWYEWLLKKNEESIKKAEEYIKNGYKADKDALSKKEKDSWYLSNSVAIDSELSRQKSILKTCKEQNKELEKKIQKMKK